MQLVQYTKQQQRGVTKSMYKIKSMYKNTGMVIHEDIYNK